MVSSSLDPQWQAFLGSTEEVSRARAEFVRLQHTVVASRAAQEARSRAQRRYAQALRDVDRTLADIGNGVRQGRELVRTALQRLEAVR
jgi:membrane-anchored protein YejM (alkaline phosphatase superfamily)